MKEEAGCQTEVVKAARQRPCENQRKDPRIHRGCLRAKRADGSKESGPTHKDRERNESLLRGGRGSYLLHQGQHQVVQAVGLNEMAEGVPVAIPRVANQERPNDCRVIEVNRPVA